MMLFQFVLPLADIKFLTPPRASFTGEPLIAQPLMIAAVVVILLIGLGWLVSGISRPGQSQRRHSPRPLQPRRSTQTFGSSAAARPQFEILVDGSNVMHWKDETPQITTVQAVVAELKARGFTPGVIFDANAGYKLVGSYMNERDFSMLLTLRPDQVFVVPKGTQADPYLLSAARDSGARIVTRDRFRDWAEAHPKVKEPGFLIRGGFRDTGALWLDEASPATASLTAPALPSRPASPDARP